MCGRVYIKTDLDGLMRAFPFAGREGALGLANQFPRYNGAPSQDYAIIIQVPDVRGPVFMTARWTKPGGRPMVTPSGWFSIPVPKVIYPKA